MKLIAAVIVVIAAVYLAQLYIPYQASDDPTPSEIHFWMSSTLRVTPNAFKVYYPKVGVGYNTNADLIVRATSVLDELKLAEPAKPTVPEAVTSLEDFAELVTRFMRDGSAVERAIINFEVCNAIVAAARRVEGMK